MAGLNINDLVLVSYRSLHLNQRILSTFTYVVTQESLQLTTTGALQLVANFFAVDNANRMLGPYRAITPPNMQIQEVRAQRIRPTRSSYASAMIDVAGLLADSAHAGNLCGVITKRTTDGTRKGIGRVRTPPIPATQYVGGVTTAGYKALMTTWAAQVKAIYTVEVGGTILTPVVKPTTFPATAFQVLDAVPQDTIRTLRRRTLRVGE